MLCIILLAFLEFSKRKFTLYLPFTLITNYWLKIYPNLNTKLTEMEYYENYIEVIKNNAR